MMSATNYFEKPAFSPEAGVVTVRPSSTALLTIDSEDRFSNYIQERVALSTGTGNNSSPYDFSITKNESIMNGYFTRLGLTEINFPFTVPNINAKTNSIILLWSVSGSGVVNSNVVTPVQYGFETPSNFAAALTTAVQSISSSLSNFLVDYGFNTNLAKVPVFAYSGGSNINVAWLPLTYNSSNYPYPNTTKQLFDMMGFTLANTIATNTAGFGKPTLFQATRYVDIVCSQLTYNQPLKDTTTQTIARDSLCRLYLGDGNGFGNNIAFPGDSNFTPPGTMPFTIYRQFQTPKMINWNSAGKAYQPVPGVLRFEVFDDTGANLSEMCSGNYINASGTLVLGRPEYTDWSATLLVSEN
jgi:hypothetical protein